MADSSQEVRTLVIEFGATHSRIGYSSADCPHVFRSTIAGRLGSSTACAPISPTGQIMPSVELYRPVDEVDGLIIDWPGVEALLADSLRILGLVSASGRQRITCPVVLIESLNASKAERERWCQLLFEEYHCPSVFFSRSGVLALYGNARSTGMVIDIGHGSTTITPIQDGFPLMMGARRVQPGVKIADESLEKALQSANPGVINECSRRSAASRCGLASTGIAHESAIAWIRDDIVRDIRQTVANVAFERIQGSAVSEACHYTLPDGANLNVGPERITAFEHLWGIRQGGVAANQDFFETEGLQDAVAAAVLACDADIRPDLVRNIVLTGGGSCVAGLTERLEHELIGALPPGLRPCIAAAAPSERLNGAWLGGSILASLDAFPTFTFSASDYQEKGAKAVHKIMG